MAEVSNTPYTDVTIPKTATLTSGMNASEAKGILDTLGININDVLGSQNIAQTVSGTTPAVDDLLGIRASLLESTGANAAYTAYQQAYAAQQAASQGLSKGLQQLSARPVSLSKITGQQAQLREVSSNEIQRLQDAANLALQTYQAKKGEAETQFGIREGEIKEKRSLQAQYPGAGIKITDSFDSAFTKIDKYQKDVAKKEWKDKLKLMAMELGVSTKNKKGGTMSAKNLEKAIAKANKSALKMAEEEHNLKMEGMRLDLENTRSIIANRGGASSADVKTANENYIFNELSNASRGEDGFVDPSVWRTALSEWQGAGGSTSEFINKFGGKVDSSGNRTGGFINPNDL